MREADPLRRALLAALGAGAVAWGAPALAQKAGQRAPGSHPGRWPQEEVELTIPFPAGGTSSMLGRTLARQFTQQTGQPMRLDYRGGGGGTAGASYVAKAPADGSRLLMGGTSLLVARATQLELDVDMYAAFTPIALVTEMPMVLLVNPRKFAGRNWTEVLAELRRKPQRYRYASAGIGSSNHLAGEWLKRQTGASMEHVPYKGSGPALLDLASGHVDVMLDGLAAALPHLQSDRLRAMFVSSAQRSHLLPDVPTAKEVGLSDFQFLVWYGIFAPKAVSAQVQARMIEVLREVGTSAPVQQEWAAMGARWPGLYGADFATFAQGQMKHWATVVRENADALRHER